MKDETEYWADTANNPMSQEEKEIAGAFYNVLEPMTKEFRYLHSVSVSIFRPGKGVNISFDAIM